MSNSVAYKQCCAARERSQTVSVVSGKSHPTWTKIISGVDAEFMATMCQGNNDQLANLFETFRAYAASQADIKNPMTGCVAVAASALGGTKDDYGEIWRKYTAFIPV
jgi:hypothetical protein